MLVRVWYQILQNEKNFLTLGLGIEWKKVYSISISNTSVFFSDLEEAKNKNADDENSDLFSILGQLESFRTCSGNFHFKLCYPELADKYSSPCNEWTQLNNPVYDSIIRDYKPVKITFDFNGIGKDERQPQDNLIDGKPFEGYWFFSIGTLTPHEGAIPGPVGNAQ